MKKETSAVEIDDVDKAQINWVNNYFNGISDILRFSQIDVHFTSINWLHRICIINGMNSFFNQIREFNSWLNIEFEADISLISHTNWVNFWSCASFSRFCVISTQNLWQFHENGIELHVIQCNPWSHLHELQH